MSDAIGKLGLPVAQVSLLLVIMATASPAYGAGSNMPWEQPLQQILQSIEVPVSKIMAVIIIINTGLAGANSVRNLCRVPCWRTGSGWRYKARKRDDGTRRDHDLRSA